MPYRTWGDYNKAQARRNQARKADAAFLAQQSQARKQRLGVTPEAEAKLQARIAASIAQGEASR